MSGWKPALPMRKFMLPLLPATLGGAAWDALGLPLGWLMGAAIVAGAFAMSGKTVATPRLLQAASLVTIGASVGLSLTPDAATALLQWAPVMVAAAAVGIALAAIAAPLLARFGHLSPATAFFSLLPGGVIEMANVGDAYGADRSAIAALHALRVAMIVSILPFGLFVLIPEQHAVLPNSSLVNWRDLAMALPAGVIGGWLANRVRMPAAWLLGAVLAVGALTGTGQTSGSLPPVLLIAAQVVIGLALGAKFRRATLIAIPRALCVAVPLLAAIMLVMALLAWAASMLIPETAATLVLCFSIGGMAEMVLTAKTLGQPAAMVAAFQAVRAILVNATAGAIWSRLDRLPIYSITRP